ncbi:MAG: tetratricopeptide repeat protein [Cyanobacteria bacterium SZAS-4]|nr:tetratricopeptide repeat protein [Cyanobacteria bacterium SZAS-4]
MLSVFSNFSFANRGLNVIQIGNKASKLNLLVVAGLMLSVSSPGYSADATVRGEYKMVSRAPRNFEFAAAGSLDVGELGYKAYRDGDLTLAINYFTQAINKDPQNISAVIDRAYARQDSGDYINAIADFQQPRIAPLQPSCLVGVGYCHTNLNNFSAAMQDFTASLALDKRSESAVSAYAGRAAVKRTLHDIPGALSDCDAALALNPDSGDARWQRAVTFYLSQQFAKAVPDLMIVVDKSPRFADAHFMLAQCYQKLGNKSGAIAEYQKANYLYQQAHDDDGIQQTNTALKVLQANLNTQNSDAKG